MDAYHSVWGRVLALGLSYRDAKTDIRVTQPDWRAKCEVLYVEEFLDICMAVLLPTKVRRSGRRAERRTGQPKHSDRGVAP